MKYYVHVTDDYMNVDLSHETYDYDDLKSYIDKIPDNIPKYKMPFFEAVKPKIEISEYYPWVVEMICKFIGKKQEVKTKLYLSQRSDMVKIKSTFVIENFCCIAEYIPISRLAMVTISEKY